MMVILFCYLSLCDLSHIKLCHVVMSRKVDIVLI